METRLIMVMILSCFGSSVLRSSTRLLEKLSKISGGVD